MPIPPRDRLKSPPWCHTSRTRDGGDGARSHNGGTVLPPNWCAGRLLPRDRRGTEAFGRQDGGLLFLSYGDVGENGGRVDHFVASGGIRHDNLDAGRSGEIIVHDVEASFLVLSYDCYSLICDVLYIVLGAPVRKRGGYRPIHFH